MNMPSITAVALLLLAVPIAGCAVFGGKAADEPPHQVLQRDGNFEIRRYEAYVVAQTTVTGPFDDALDTGFRRLFNYITGNNRAKTDIRMTAPVLVEPRGERIAMAAPVFARQVPPGSSVSAGAPDAWTVRFVLPPGFTVSNAPQPITRSIELVEMPSRDVAVVRFSGLLRSDATEQNRLRLKTWLDRRAMPHADDWELAGYHPPWTLPPFRRNEIFVTLK